MKAIEFESEVALIAQAIGLAQQGFDFVIDAFHAAVVDPMVPPAHDVVNGPAIFNSYLSRHDSSDTRIPSFGQLNTNQTMG
jgi:hypothetical protein